MNIVFFGTPEFATTFLAALHADEDISVAAVVCQSDKPVGRKQVMTAPPTKMFAIEHGIPVLQPEKKGDILFLLKSAFSHPEHSEGSLEDIDAFVIVAYGTIIPQEVLDIPKYGSINVHPSLLPKYRGPSPIQSAILNQDLETGISIMLIDSQMDHGPILNQLRVSLKGSEDAETLQTHVGELGAPLLVRTLKEYVAGNIEPKEQDHEAATYCKLLNKEDGNIDWTQSAEAIDAQVRAYRPWPGTYTILDGKILKIHQVSRLHNPLPHPERAERVEGSLTPGEIQIANNHLYIGTGSTPLEVLELQPEGRPRMTAQAFLNGNTDVNGKRFT